MGHSHISKSYQSLQQRLDRNLCGAPANEFLWKILQIMYTEDEAAIGAKMPMNFATASTVAKRIKRPVSEIETSLEKMADKGLVFDIERNEKRYYMLNPTVIGFFEFSMMRLGPEVTQVEFKELSELYQKYCYDTHDFAEQALDGTTMIGRAVCDERDYDAENFSDVMPYEKARDMVEQFDSFSLGICYCRHKNYHLGKPCTKPMEICLSLGFGADYVVKRNLAKRIDKAQALEKLDEAWENGLVHVADNVKRNITYICNCCGCCCGQLHGITHFHFEGAVHSSNFIATLDEEKCIGCKKCEEACPIDAIAMKEVGEKELKSGKTKKLYKAQINKDICLGCGVCTRTCNTKALQMERRPVRVFTPETMFEKVLLQAVERNKLQYLIFDNFDNLGHKAMNAMLKVFLGLNPVKKLLVSDMFRSKFLETIKSGQKAAGMDWVSKL